MPKIQLRHDTSANFTSVNPVLLEGEFAYETDTKKIKVGDGTTAYTSLEYFGGDTSAIPELQEAVEQLELDYGSLADKVDELETSLENKQDKLKAGDNIFIGYEVIDPNVQPNWGTVQDEWIDTNINNVFNTITGNESSISFTVRKTANFNGKFESIAIVGTKTDTLFYMLKGDDDFTIDVSVNSSKWLHIPLPSNTTVYDFYILLVNNGTTQDLYVTSSIDGKTYTLLNQAKVGWNLKPLNLSFASSGDNILKIQRSSVKLYNGSQVPSLVISATTEDPVLPDNVTTQGNTFNGANQLVQLDSTGKLPDNVIPLDELNLNYARLNLTGADDSGQTINPATTFMKPINANGGIAYATKVIISADSSSVKISPSNTTNGNVQLMSPTGATRLNATSKGVILYGNAQVYNDNDLTYYRILDERDITKVTNEDGLEYNDGSADYTIVGVDTLTTSVDLGISKSGYKVNMLSSAPLERNHTETIYDTSMDSQIAGLAMPSINYKELTWPKSTQNIQGLPNQDGYLYLEKNATAVGQTCMVRILDSSNNFLYRLRFISSAATDICTYFIPLPAGCKVSLTYSLNGDTSYLRFFTCKGCGIV